MVIYFLKTILFYEICLQCASQSVAPPAGIWTIYHFETAYICQLWRNSNPLQNRVITFQKMRQVHYKIPASLTNDSRWGWHCPLVNFGHFIVSSRKFGMKLFFSHATRKIWLFIYFHYSSSWLTSGNQTYLAKCQYSGHGIILYELFPRHTCVSPCFCKIRKTFYSRRNVFQILLGYNRKIF